MQKNADGSISELHTRTNESGIDLHTDSRLQTAWNEIRDSKKLKRWSLYVFFPHIFLQNSSSSWSSLPHYLLCYAMSDMFLL